MKRILLILSTCGMLLSSCADISFTDKFLSQQPEQLGAELDTLFSNQEYAEQVLTKAYYYIPTYLPQGRDWKGIWNGMRACTTEELTDLSHSYSLSSGANALYYSGIYDATTTDCRDKFSYSEDGIWYSIRHAYIFIENVDRVPDMPEELKKQKIGEAKVIIALNYFEMLRNMGGIVWLDHSLDLESTKNFVAQRLSIEESVQKISDLLDEAAEVLPWSYPSKDCGRMSKAAAMGLKFQMLTFVASPLFNSDRPYHPMADKLTWFGNYDINRWEAAKEAGKAFLDALAENGYYKLSVTKKENTTAASVQSDTGSESDFKELRKGFIDAYFIRGNEEQIISIRHVPVAKGNGSATWQRYGGQAFWNLDVWRKMCPTLDWFKMFPMADGTDFPKDFDWANPPFNPFKNRDPRLFESIVIADDYYTPVDFPGNGRAQAYEGGLHSFGVGSSSGFRMRKHLLEYSPATSMYKAAHESRLRLAEIFLTYAEVINELEGPTEEAYSYVKPIRDRVGMPNFPDGLSKDEFREMLLRERAIEFGYENVRLYDLIRYKKADVFKKQLQGLKIDKDDTEAIGYRLTPVDLPKRYLQNNWDSKWYLSAFPDLEIQKDYGLQQNPGW